jgi:hypothetical protein
VREPLQLVMERVVLEVHVSAEESEKWRTEELLLPRSMVELAVRVRVLSVSEKPPVAKVPPLRLILTELLITSGAPSRRVPELMLTVPVKVFAPERV